MIRYTFALVALLSFLPKHVAANDCLAYSDLCRQNDGEIALATLVNNQNDVKAGLAYILSREIPDKLNGRFDLKGGIKKEVIKHFINRYLVNDSLNINLDLGGSELSIITNDQALEVGYHVAQDLLADKARSDVLSHAGKVYVREKIVGILLWILEQSELENILPDGLVQSDAYRFLKKDGTRYGVDELLGKLC